MSGPSRPNPPRPKTPFRAPAGAKVSLFAALASSAAMLIDRQGLGRDPLIRSSTKAIALGGLIWTATAAIRHGIDCARHRDRN